MDAETINILLWIGFGVLFFLYVLFVKAINDIDKAYKAGCTLADPTGKNHRIRKGLKR